jgi:hypothetical protein
MTRLPENVAYQRTEDFVARTIAGETVLVPIRRQIGDLESIYTLNEVATFIWDRLAKPATIADVFLALEQVFAGEPAEMRDDLEEFVKKLLDLGAIKLPTEPPEPERSTPSP